VTSQPPWQRQAVNGNGEALQYAAPELQADRGVVLVAVSKAGAALRFAVATVRHAESRPPGKTLQILRRWAPG
jgi:hypothetical protein